MITPNVNMPATALPPRVALRASPTGGGQRTGAIGQQFLARLAQERRAAEERAEETAALAAVSDLRTFAHERLHGEGGALAALGANAGPAAAEARKALAREAERTRGGLGSDRQRSIFNAMLLDVTEATETKLTSHVGNQTRLYAAQTVDRAKAVSIDAVRGAVATGAITVGADGVSHQLVDREVAQAENAIVHYANRYARQLPLPKDEWITQQREALRKDVHQAVVDDLLTGGDVPTAQAYLAHHGPGMAGGQRADLEAAVDAAATVYGRQRAADEAFDATFDRDALFSPVAGSPTLAQMEAEALERVDAIEDPEDRTAARRLVRDRYSERRRLLDQARAELHEQLEARVFEGDDMTDVQADPRWQRLTPAARRSLTAVAKQQRAGEYVITDDVVYEDLLRKSATDPTGFSRVNLREHRHKLDQRDYDRLLGLQNATLAAQSEAAARAQGTTQVAASSAIEDHRSLTAAIDDEFDSILPEDLLGTSDAKEVKAARARFHRSVGDTLRQEQARRGGAPLSEHEAIEIARGQLGRVITSQARGSGGAMRFLDVLRGNTTRGVFARDEQTRLAFDLGLSDIVLGPDDDPDTFNLVGPDEQAAMLQAVLPLTRAPGRAREIARRAALLRIAENRLSPDDPIREPTENEIALAYIDFQHEHGLPIPTDRDLRVEALHLLRTQGVFEP